MSRAPHGLAHHLGVDLVADQPTQLAPWHLSNTVCSEICPDPDYRGMGRRFRSEASNCVVLPCVKGGGSGTSADGRASTCRSHAGGADKSCIRDLTGAA